MGGGKSRALCEEAYQAALDHPGIEILIGRLQHTDVVASTRKTMFREVLPPELVVRCRIVKSGGYDFIEFPNGSTIHFVGVVDPVKFHSAELGMVIIDEAHQVDADTVQTLNSRLRQKCKECLESKAYGCSHMPHSMLFGANPENPGHWLHQYFLQDADETDWGKYKPELRLDEGAASLGDTEFIQAKATDNPYLPEEYVSSKLASMEEHWRQRYLEGMWVFVDGSCIFTPSSLTYYQKIIPEPLYRFDFEPVGIGDRARKKESKRGRIRVYVEPVETHSYAIGADVATGRGADFSCAYVIDLATMELAAEYHAKLDADIFARDLHFLGRWYNTAVVAPESTGGWGEPVIISLRDGKGGRPPYPKMYRHRLDSSVDLDIVQRYGYPTTQKTRSQILNQLQRAVRERSIPYLTSLLHDQCGTFCEFEDGRTTPRAQPNCHDDAVLAAAITVELYRQFGHHPEREARIAKRKRIRPKLSLYPWKAA